MNITDIRIRKIYEDARLKALVSVTIGCTRYQGH